MWSEYKCATCNHNKPELYPKETASKILQGQQPQKQFANLQFLVGYNSTYPYRVIVKIKYKTFRTGPGMQ